MEKQGALEGMTVITQQEWPKDFKDMGIPVELDGGFTIWTLISLPSMPKLQ